MLIGRPSSGPSSPAARRRSAAAASRSTCSSSTAATALRRASTSCSSPSWRSASSTAESSPARSLRQPLAGAGLRARSSAQDVPRGVAIPRRLADAALAQHELAHLAVLGQRQLVDDRRGSAGSRSTRGAAGSDRISATRIELRARTRARRRPSRRPRRARRARGSRPPRRRRGCDCSTCSTSQAEMFSPRRRIASLRRSRKRKLPSASRTARSPDVEPQVAPARDRLLGHAPVAGRERERLVGAHHELARRAVGHLLVVLVDDLDLVARHRASHRPRALPAVERADHRVRLGHAEAVAQQRRRSARGTARAARPASRARAPRARGAAARRARGRSSRGSRPSRRAGRSRSRRRPSTRSQKREAEKRSPTTNSAPWLSAWMHALSAFVWKSGRQV